MPCREIWTRVFCTLRPERIEQEVQTILESFGHGNGHVFNLGHGIHPEVNPEHAKAFIDAIHKHSPMYHKESL